MEPKITEDDGVPFAKSNTEEASDVSIERRFARRARTAPLRSRLAGGNCAQQSIGHEQLNALVLGLPWLRVSESGVISVPCIAVAGH